MSFVRDLRVAIHSLRRTPGLSLAVILTLALGIGANAAIFTLVRGVLLKPLVNRDEDRLIYIRQSAPGIQADNITFSVPEIQDLRASVKTISAFGDFSTIGFTMVGVGEPREVKAGVVGGSYFDVMGLHPVLGRLMGFQDDGPNAAGVVVLTYRFWTTAFKKDPSVIDALEQQRSDNQQHQPAPANLCGDADCCILRAVGRRQYVDHHPHLVAKNTYRPRHSSRPRY